MNSSVSQSKLSAFIIAVICAGLYLNLAVQSNADTGIGVFDFLSQYWLIAFGVLGYWVYLNYRQLSISPLTVFLWAIIFRIIGVFGSPILEDDFYRYLLDGCLFISSGSPYGITPESLFQTNQLSDECREALSWVNNPDIPTIYGPVLQYLFALAHLISPANVTLLQGIFSLFDLGLILCLLRLAPAHHVMLYAWCPLAVKEIAFTAHPDIVGIFFVFAAFIALKSRHYATASILAGIALATKIFALLLVPFIIFRLGIRYWLLTALAVALLYAPFLLQHKTDMLVLGIFAQNWLFNASGFLLAKFFLPDHVARLLCMALFSVGWLVYFYQFHKKQWAFQPHELEIPRGDGIFGLFFLLSPVFNAWYLIWLLPFAAIRPSHWAWTISVTVSLSYITGLNIIESGLRAYEIAPWALIAEYGAVAAALYLDISGRRRTKS